jgi:putative PIN family toxin of toxin-antitoxin system
MQKIILDTNVIVSGLISNSIPTILVYNFVLTKKVEICLSDEVFSEYLDVLNRGKFTKYDDFRSKAQIVLNRIKEVATYYITEHKIDVLKDLGDNKFLELASSSSADFLVTGNTLDFTLSEFECTKILTPRQYWENYAPVDF